MKTTTCNSCGAPVVWSVLPSEKRCPIDAEPKTLATFPPGKTPIYALEDIGHTVRAVKLDPSTLGPGDTFYVSHFATCPHANRHSRKAERGSADSLSLCAVVGFVCLGALVVQMLRLDECRAPERRLTSVVSKAESQALADNSELLRLRAEVATLREREAKRNAEAERMERLIKQGRALPLPLQIPKGWRP